MSEWDEMAAQFDNLARAAEALELDSRELINEALGLAADDARSSLLLNLGEAIAFSGEFQRELLEDRLYRYFSDPRRVSANRETGVVINVDPNTAVRQWLQAQAAANAARKQGKKLRGWAANPSPAQRRAYWRNVVWPDEETWADTIEQRLAFLEDEDSAPFWYFLEYGTGVGAHPELSPQMFVKKTQDEVGGFRRVNQHLERIIRNYEIHAAMALEQAASQSSGAPTIVKQTVRWTDWYSWMGRQKRHQYIPGEGLFRGYQIEFRE